MTTKKDDMKKVVVGVVVLALAILACSGSTLVVTSTPQIEKSKLQPSTGTPTGGGSRADATPTYTGVLITPDIVVDLFEVVVLAETLRIRECAATTCAVVGYLHQGDHVFVGLKRTGNMNCSAWAAYTKGWICLDWVMVIE